MPPAERRALILLLTLAVLGHAVRLVLSRPGSAPGEIELVQALPGRSPLAHKDSTIALARPLEPGERIDLDRAGAQEVGRLPRVGPGLAKRIVADREARGPFGSLEGLDRVPGVGAAVLGAVRDHVRFSGVATNAISSSAAATSADMISLNRATARELEALPGIGARRAEAIVRDRERNGPFPSVDALTRIPGIKPALVARVRQRLQVP
ncbi:MAG TPA: helix-hairpin-helix domain-containing protein [Gemmatimonadales bacterium]|nr:helix-hairpin-helix domain-containing protein [Gemmatimonadales bacterium]